MLAVRIFRVRTFSHPSFADQSAKAASANVPNDSQVTSVFWPIASRYRYLTHQTLESLVSFPHPSFAGQSADDTSTNVPNDSQVTSLSWPIARLYRYLTFNGANESLVSFPNPSLRTSSLTMLPRMFHMLCR